MFIVNNIHDFSEWLRTCSNPTDVNRFRSDTGKNIFRPIQEDFVELCLSVRSFSSVSVIFIQITEQMQRAIVRFLKNLKIKKYPFKAFT